MTARLVALALAAGCATPTGTVQTWPPPLGLTIAAAAFADLDGDGILDLAIAGTGSRAGEGLYLLRGGTDWDGASISSFTRFTPHPLAAVAALAVVDGALVLAVNKKGTATLETLDPDTLATLATLPLAIASKQRLAIADVAGRAVVLGDADVADVDPTGPALAAPALPSPVGTKWPAPQSAVGFGASSIAIATAAQIFTADTALPIAYATVRPAADTAPLSAQIPATVTSKTGALLAAIVGIDAAGQRLCAIDLAATIGAACIAIPVAPGARLALVAGELDGKPGTDVAILASIGTDTKILRVTNLVLDGAILTADPVGASADASLEAPIATIVPATPAARAHVFALGISGETTCVDC